MILTILSWIHCKLSWFIFYENNEGTNRNNFQVKDLLESGNIKSEVALFTFLIYKHNSFSVTIIFYSRYCFFFVLSCSFQLPLQCVLLSFKNPISIILTNSFFGCFIQMCVLCFIVRQKKEAINSVRFVHIKFWLILSTHSESG